MTLWLGQDGFDYPFQSDYLALWDACAEALRVIAAHNPQIDVSLEYKPNEPRAFSLLPDAATTLLMLSEVGAPKHRSHARLRPCSLRRRDAGLRGFP
jgi:xylose isomerase